MILWEDGEDHSARRRVRPQITYFISWILFVFAGAMILFSRKQEPVQEVTLPLPARMHEGDTVIVHYVFVPPSSSTSVVFFASKDATRYFIAHLSVDDPVILHGEYLVKKTHDTTLLTLSLIRKKRPRPSQPSRAPTRTLPEART